MFDECVKSVCDYSALCLCVECVMSVGDFRECSMCDEFVMRVMRV